MQPSHPSNPPRNPAPSPLPPPVEIADKSAERALSALAHGAIAFGLFGIGFLVSLGIAGVIWLYARRSPEVRFHSEQAGCYQCSVLLINVVCVIALIAGGVLSIFTAFQGGGGSVGGGTIIGLCLFAIWFFGTIIYGLVAAVFVLMGKRFKYPIIGDRFEKRVW